MRVTEKSTESGAAKEAYVPPHARNQAAKRTVPDRAASFASAVSRQQNNPELEAELFGSRISSGINFDKYDDIPVTATGSDVPKPCNSFDEADLHPLIGNVIRLAQYTKPTPIQKYSFGIVDARRDLMACAQTGSGKTGAFLVPIISKMLKIGRASESLPNQSIYAGTRFFGGRTKIQPKALILAPTRELAQQIFDEARKFSYGSWVQPCVIFGGEDPMPQLRSMEKGCDLLVATPGRLTDMIQRGKISLAGVHSLVLDEADRMLDMGFEPQIRSLVSQTDMPATGKRQTLMFSATFPREIQDLAKTFLANYIFVTVGKVGASSENIQQHVEYVAEDQKRSLLIDILKNEGADGLTLIFTETKRNADILDTFLYQNGFACTSIHGDRTQAQRQEALAYFKSKQANILVATSVASRGLDIPNVTHVINYEVPADLDDYVHRIGRTGRAGNTGKSTTFFTDSNRGSARELIKILEDANQQVPDFLRSFAATYGGSGGRSTPISGGGSSRWGGGRFNRSTPSFGGGPRLNGPPANHRAPEPSPGRSFGATRSSNSSWDI